MEDTGVEFASERENSKEHEGVKLKKGDTIWRPIRLRKEILKGEELETQKLYRKFMGILNKLTIQKFDILLDQVKTLAINNQLRLEGITHMIFEKAINEPMYCKVYATMCYKLSTLKVPADNATSHDHFVNFRALIINKVQKEFENDKENQHIIVKLTKEYTGCTDSAKTKELKFLLEEEKRRVRMRAVGNVKFIGELHNLEMLTSKIIDYCMKSLICKIEDVKLECLCQLLTTVGERMGHETYKVVPDIIKKMQDVLDCDTNNISWRVRFMMQDVIALGKEWVANTIIIPQTITKYKRKPKKKSNTSHDGSGTSNIFSDAQVQVNLSEQELDKKNIERAPKPYKSRVINRNKNKIQTIGHTSDLQLAQGDQKLVPKRLTNASKFTVNVRENSRNEQMMNECILYGHRLTTVLMNLEDHDRISLMKSIDNLVIKTTMQATAMGKYVRNGTPAIAKEPN